MCNRTIARRLGKASTAAVRAPRGRKWQPNGCRRAHLSVDDSCETEALAHRVAELVLAGLRSEGPWLDKKRLAGHLACSVRWIEDRMAEGLPHAMIAGRVKFRAVEVEAWLEARGHIDRRTDVAATRLRTHGAGGRLGVTGSEKRGGTAGTARPRPPEVESDGN